MKLKTKLSKAVNYSGYNNTIQKTKRIIDMGSYKVAKGTKVLIVGVNYAYVTAINQKDKIKFFTSHDSIDWK